MQKNLELCANLLWYSFEWYANNDKYFFRFCYVYNYEMKLLSNSQKEKEKEIKLPTVNLSYPKTT